MINPDELLLLLAAILLLGFAGEIGFRKKRIPDMLLLLLVGVIIHYTGLVPSAYLALMKSLLGFFGTFALIFIVFGGVIRLDLKKFGKSLSRGTALALADLIFVMIILTAILYYYLKLSLIDSVLLSAILSESSVTFIMPLISRIKMNEAIAHIVEVETIMNSVMNIIVVLLILSIRNQQVSVIGLTSYLFGTVSEAIVLGGVVGIVWLIILRQALTPHYYIATIAMLFVLWGVSDYLGASAILTVFIFSVIIANSGPISRIVRVSGTINTESLSYFNQEITFFVMTLFYVYIGILVNIFDFRGFLIAAFIVVDLVAIRVAEVYSVQGITKWFGSDSRIVSSFVQRGSTVIVLSGVLLSVDPTAFSLFGNILFYVVILSILTGSLLFSITSKRYSSISLG